MKKTFVRLGSSRFQRSRLMPDVARISEVEMYRYFEEFFDLLNFATIGRLSRRDDQKLVDIMNLHPFIGEIIHAQKYEIGEYYNLHDDFFHKGDDFQVYCEWMGQRTWTTMV